MGKFMLCTIFFIVVGSDFVSGVLHLGSECLPAQNSSVNTIYRANLRTLLDSLARDVPLEDNFFNTSVGNGSDRVYGLAQCRADVSPNTCSHCLNDSVSVPLRDCPESKDLVIWSTLCGLRFSNESFFGELWNSSSSSTYSGSGLDHPLAFSRGFSMMEALGRTVPDQPLMFETGAISVGSDGERYGLAQCTRDLSKSDCQNCLEELLATYRSYVLNRTGWEMLSVNCGMWYNNFLFFDNNSRIEPSGSTPSPDLSGARQIWSEGNLMFASVAFLLLHWIS